MSSFASLLRNNRNYRNTWMGQVVSEIGDNFNNIAVFSLAISHSKADPQHSAVVVMGVMMSRAIPAMFAGPLAGIVLDRLDRRQIMIASDLIRGVVALLFILTIHRPGTWLLYLLSALLMGASPFFTAGRSAILPRITTDEELHTANSLTQTTQWVTTAIGSYLAGLATDKFGFGVAFVLNASSFFFSAFAISRLRLVNGHFRAQRSGLTEVDVVRPWHEYREGLRYMAATPLVLAIALVGVGWATGGGASQILFSVFGEIVFNRGASGIGMIWAAAGVGLVIGGTFAHRIGERISFQTYKRIISISYIVHGLSFVNFALMGNFSGALVMLAMSRAAVGLSSVLNYTQLLRHVSDEYRGRVFATMESMVWTAMLLSMMAAGIASQFYDPSWIGVGAGIAASTTALFWGWANMTGRLPEPAVEGVAQDDLEFRGRLRA